MAKVTELKYGSREGSTWSMFEPSSGTVRVFTVVVDDQNDDPRVTLRTTQPEGTNQTLVNEGSLHPWDRNLYARDFSILGRLNNITWTVSVSYAQNELTTTTWNGWTPSVQTASVIERRYETLPLYTSDYLPGAGTLSLIYGSGFLNNGVKRVASLRYVLPPEGPPAPDNVPTHWTHGPDGERIDLIQTRLRETRDAGYDYERPIVVLTMDKDVFSLPYGYAFYLAHYKGKVNAQRFLPNFMGIRRGHVAFQNGTVNVVQGKPPGSVSAGSYYHVQLIFVISAESMGFVRKIHTFELDGAVTPVFNAGPDQLQYEDFKQAHQVDLNSLLGMFR